MNVTQLYTFFNTPKSSNPLQSKSTNTNLYRRSSPDTVETELAIKKNIYYFKLKENTTNVNSRRCCGCCDCWRGAENGTGARTGRRAGEEVSIIAQAKTKNSANQQDPKLWEIEWKKKTLDASHPNFMFLFSVRAPRFTNKNFRKNKIKLKKMLA